MSNFLIDVMRAVGYGICHQMPSRSLHFGGRALPVCARDTGIFIGFTVCFVVLLIAYRGEAPRYPTWPRTSVLVLFILPTFIDAVTSYGGLRVSSNAVRLATGALAGTGIAAILFPLAAGSLAVLRGRGPAGSGRRMLEQWWALPALLLAPLAVSLATWPSWPGAFWLWAPLVTLAIVFTLFALNFTLVALLFEWVRGAERTPKFAVVVAIGLAFALVELAASNRLHWLVERLA
ncbi:MAG: DUF2085 domain-containing protein [Candidatus Geothermincolia bacterium]